MYVGELRSFPVLFITLVLCIYYNCYVHKHLCIIILYYYYEHYVL